MKRARSEKGTSSLTGGTGDYSPQILSITIVQTAADTFTTEAIALPIPRMAAGKGKSVVMEILRVDFIFDDLTAIAGQVSLSPMLQTAQVSGSGAFTQLQDPRTFAYASLDGIFATAVGFAFNSRVISRDLTDGSGRGYLVGTDQIFFRLDSVGTGRANSCCAKILYRFKGVTLEEYVGIVQGQQ